MACKNGGVINSSGTTELLYFVNKNEVPTNKVWLTAMASNAPCLLLELPPEIIIMHILPHVKFRADFARTSRYSALLVRDHTSRSTVKVYSYSHLTDWVRTRETNSYFNAVSGRVAICLELLYSISRLEQHYGPKAVPDACHFSSEQLTLIRSLPTYSTDSSRPENLKTALQELARTVLVTLPPKNDLPYYNQWSLIHHMMTNDSEAAQMIFRICIHGLLWELPMHYIRCISDGKWPKMEDIIMRSMLDTGIHDYPWMLKIADAYGDGCASFLRMCGAYVHIPGPDNNIVKWLFEALIDEHGLLWTDCRGAYVSTDAVYEMMDVCFFESNLYCIEDILERAKGLTFAEIAEYVAMKDDDEWRYVNNNTGSAFSLVRVIYEQSLEPGCALPDYVVERINKLMQWFDEDEEDDDN